MKDSLFSVICLTDTRVPHGPVSRRKPFSDIPRLLRCLYEANVSQHATDTNLSPNPTGQARDSSSSLSLVGLGTSIELAKRQKNCHIVVFVVVDRRLYRQYEQSVRFPVTYGDGPAKECWKRN